MGWQTWVGALGLAGVVCTSGEAGEIRATTPMAKTLVAEARNRSDTLRQLAATIEASDLIVLVQTSAEPGLWRGETRLVATVPTARVVVIRINEALDSRERLAVLGHEWQHACEVAVHPTVTDQAGMQELFARVGQQMASHTKVFETRAAQEVERTVRSELARRSPGDEPRAPLVVAAAADSASQERPAIVVLVNDMTGQKAADRTTALRRAGELLAVAQTGVVWRICGQTDDHGRDSCTGGPASGAFIVRIMHAPRQAQLMSPTALGHALIDAESSLGVLATVFADRVARKAAQAKVAEADLLGRVIAHELGHLLLGHAGHGTQGLMRADWTKESLRHSRTSDWLFTAMETALIQDRLRRPVRVISPPSRS